MDYHFLAACTVVFLFFMFLYPWSERLGIFNTIQLSLSSTFFRFTVRSDPRWCCTYLLDATDPLFIDIGRAFITQQLKGMQVSYIYWNSSSCNGIWVWDELKLKSLSTSSNSLYFLQFILYSEYGRTSHIYNW